MFTRLVTILLAACLALASAHTASAFSIKELTTIRGTGDTVLWGWGLVIGLEGTGDSGEYLPMARQIAQLMERGGNTIAEVRELEDSRNVAVVMVTCKIPRNGARKGQNFDVDVLAANNATSIDGGNLFIAPLLGPLPGQGVYAFAQGEIYNDNETPTTGKVTKGANIVTDIRMQTLDEQGRMILHLEPEYSGWSNAKLLANAINQDRQGLLGEGDNVAFAEDEKTVIVTLPRAELANPANFIGTILDIRLDPSLLATPARVILNRDTGTLVLRGDVRISPGVISHENLEISTIEPPVEPTPDNPVTEQSSVTTVATEAEERPLARAQDLLEAMKRLDVEVEDQMEIIEALHSAGLLHAELVFE